MNYLFLHYTSFRHKVHRGFVPFLFVKEPFSLTEKKSWGKIWLFLSFSFTLLPKGCLVCPPAVFRCRGLLDKIEALCSFLQGGNLRNFNHCKECLETARVLLKAISK